VTTISLCMIVKNEEKYLGDCLNSVKDLVDEIIIVDTGSTDNTEEIASEYTNNIYFYEFDDDFSKARNYSFSKATKEYVFWLDADDVMSDEGRKKFKELKNRLDNEIGVVAMKYNCIFDEEGNVVFSLYKERLIRRELKPRWIEPVHEYIDVDADIYKTDITILHKRKRITDERNLKIYRKFLYQGNELSERGTMYYGIELLNNDLIQEAIFYLDKFLKMKTVWDSDCELACLELSACYTKLHEYDKAIKSLLQCFEKCVPRAEVCCEIGNGFIYKKDYDVAVFWFELAVAMKKIKDDFSFVLDMYLDFIPNYQLGICHYFLGDIERAIYYNDEALKIKPNNINAKKNDTLYKKMQERIATGK